MKFVQLKNEEFHEAHNISQTSHKCKSGYDWKSIQHRSRKNWLPFPWIVIPGGNVLTALPLLSPLPLEVLPVSVHVVPSFCRIKKNLYKRFCSTIFMFNN